MRSLSKLNKRGQVLDITGGTIVALMVLVFTIFAVLYGIATLKPSTFFTANSAEANATSYLQSNVTDGVMQFGTQIPTAMKVLGVVLALSAVAILILYVRRMASSNVGGL